MELKKGRKKNGNERDREENRERIRETENKNIQSYHRDLWNPDPAALNPSFDFDRSRWIKLVDYDVKFSLKQSPTMTNQSRGIMIGQLHGHQSRIIQ